jgi:hypothetical protein
MRIIGPVTGIEIIAEGHGIRELAKIKERHGDGNWKKKKGIATVQLDDGRYAKAEIHWYEAHGIGKVKPKVKAWL